MKTTIPRQQRGLWLSLGVLLAAIVLLGGSSLSCQKPRVEADRTSRSIGTKTAIPYPDFPIIFYQGQEVLAGKEARFSSLLGGPPIVLNFWASNCPPCSAEMPEFQKVYENYQGKVLFIGLDIGRFFPPFGDEDDSKRQLKQLGVTYPAVTPADIKTVEILEVRGLPTTVFITPRGERYRTWAGSLNQKKLTELVEALLQASGT